MIEVKTRSGKERKFTFPCIVVGKETGVMILMTREGEGLCLEQGLSRRFVKGKYYTDLKSPDSWNVDLFDGEVVLTNK